MAYETLDPTTMMEIDCAAVREALATGSGADAPEVQAHLDSCPLCGMRGVAQAEQPGAEAVEELFGVVEQAIAQERGAAAWLKERSTRARAAWVAAALVGVLLAVWVLARRPDIGASWSPRVLVELGCLGVAWAVTLRLALRPLHLPELGRAPAVSAVAFGAGLPVMLALLPAAALPDPAGAAPRGILACFGFGALLCLPVLGPLLVAQRGGGRRWLALALAAVVGGLAANLALELHCPSTHPVHLLLGHAGVSVVLLALLLPVGGWLGRRG